MHEPGFFAEPSSWVAIAFVIFFVLFGSKLWKVLTSLLDQRTAAVRAQLAEAQRLRQEAEAMRADAGRQRESAMADAARLLESARLEAARLANAASVEALASARRRETMAMERIAAAEKAAIDAVRIAAAEIAGSAAARVIRDDFGPERDAALIDHAIAGLPSALAPRRAA
jgi:F-type H+-transporting ATPase subunit b